VAFPNDLQARDLIQQRRWLLMKVIALQSWSLGWVSAIDTEGRTIWIVDAHRDNESGFVVRADEKLTAFLELESTVKEKKLLIAD
jgi:hypothetical protein